MWLDTAENTPASPAGNPVPWSAKPDRFIARIREQVPFASLGLAVLNLPHPRADEWLLAEGWRPEAVERWCASELEKDPLLRAARRSGLALARRDELPADTGLPVHDHLLLAMVCESLPLQRWWLLMLGRDGSDFTPVERKLAGLLLRHTQAGFDRTDEPGMSRLLIGHDDRLIHADPGAQILLLHRPQVLENVVGVLHDLVPQRWPEMEESAGHDLVAAIDGRETWVRFHRRSAAAAAGAAHWYVELRPLEPGELPVAGKLSDPRIAHALGYIHDHFQDAPNLAQIARAVHVSPFHFHRLFSRLVGASPKHYLQRRQLQAAKWLLRNTRLPIRVVARRAGFSSHGHFTSTFHRLVGAIPSQYRETQS